MRSIALIFIAAFLLAAAALPALAATTAVVRGTVFVDGAKSAGAEVTLSGVEYAKTAKTDAPGILSSPRFPSAAIRFRLDSATSPGARSRSK